MRLQPLLLQSRQRGFELGQGVLKLHALQLLTLALGLLRRLAETRRALLLRLA